MMVRTVPITMPCQIKDLHEHLCPIRHVLMKNSAELVSLDVKTKQNQMILNQSFLTTFPIICSRCSKYQRLVILSERCSMSLLAVRKPQVVFPKMEVIRVTDHPPPCPL